jgi:hypothetical protein
VGGALLVGCLATLAGDLALTLRIHRCETAVLRTATLFIALIAGCHGSLLVTVETAASCGRPTDAIDAPMSARSEDMLGTAIG